MERHRALNLITHCDVAVARDFFKGNRNIPVDEPLELVPGREGAPALFWAMEAGCYRPNNGNNIVRYLVEMEKADVTYRHRGNNYIYYASSWGDLPLAQYLLGQIPEEDHYSMLNSISPRGETAIIQAVRGGHSTLLLFLLNNGALPALGRDGQQHESALWFAIRNRTDMVSSNDPGDYIDAYTSLESIELLLNYGADITEKVQRTINGGNRIGKSVGLGRGLR